MQVQGFSLLPATLAIAAVLGLAACQRQTNDQTVGQRAGQAIDTTVAKVEQKTEQAAAEIKQGADIAGRKLKDAAISTSVNAKLAADPSLSALKIDVDTSEGRVALKGTAPSAAAKTQATQLAQAVAGVVSVDNQLTVSN